MIPKKIKELDDIWFYYPLREYKQVLTENIYPQQSIIVEGIYKIVSSILKEDSIQTNFEEVFIYDAQQSENLREGNLHYLNLLRNTDIITDQNKDLESLTPLTDCVKEIISKFSDHSHHSDGRHSIYHVLCIILKKEIGKKIAQDSDLRLYKDWLTISSKEILNHDIHSSWISNIPLPYINNAKEEIFNKINNTPLENKVLLTRPSSENPQACHAYLESLSKIENLKPFHYVNHPISHSDDIFLKSSCLLDNQLVYMTGLENWLKFIDHNKYKIVQSNLLLSIEEPSEFVELIKLICSCNNLTTNKTRLILIVLDEYFHFLSRNLSRLKSYNVNNIVDNEEIKLRVISEADALRNEWVNNLIPEIFTEIFENIVSISSENDELLHNIFLWVNSHQDIYIQKDSKNQLRLIQISKDKFIDTILSNGIEIDSLITPLCENEINWQILDSIAEILEKTKSKELQSTLYKYYNSFIKSPKFLYYLGAGTNANILINNAYTFSAVLMFDDNPLKKWEDLYSKYKAKYEGWYINHYLDAVSSRESFLLAVGVGISNLYHFRKKQKEGQAAIKKVSDIILRQIRQHYDEIAIEYIIPLQFLSLTINNFFYEDLVKIINEFTQNLDSLEQVLVFWSEINISANNPMFLDALNIVVDRVNNEFWVLETRYVNKKRQHQLDNYIVLKDKILSLAIKS